MPRKLKNPLALPLSNKSFLAAPHDYSRLLASNCVCLVLNINHNSAVLDSAVDPSDPVIALLHHLWIRWFMETHSFVCNPQLPRVHLSIGIYRRSRLLKMSVTSAKPSFFLFGNIVHAKFFAVIPSPALSRRIYRLNVYTRYQRLNKVL